MKELDVDFTLLRNALAQHEGHTVRISGAFGSKEVTVRTLNTDDQTLGWQYGGFVVVCQHDHETVSAGW